MQQVARNEKICSKNEKLIGKTLPSNLWKALREAHYLAASEGNAQSRNTCRQAFACLIRPSLGLIFAGGVGGLAISDHLANRLVSRFGSNNTELLRGVIGPMSSLDDCLNTVFNEVYQPARNLQKQMPCHGPYGKSIDLLHLFLSEPKRLSSVTRKE